MDKRKKYRKKKNHLGAILPLLFLAALVFGALYLFQSPTVILAEKKAFSVGETVMFSDLVLEVKDGVLLTEDFKLDSSKAGSRTVAFSVKTRLGQTKNESFTVEFVDKAAPVISAPESFRTMVEQEIDLLKDVSATDDSGENLTVTVKGDYDFHKAGEYRLSYIARDSSGNLTEKAFTLTVAASPFDENGKMIDGVYTTTNGFKLEIKDSIAYVDGHMIVNKSFSLPRGFSSTGDGTRTLRPEASQAFSKMKAAAPAEIQKELFVRSGVRTISDQTVIFNNYVKRDGLEEALTYSSRPGHSEHHTGLGMDITTADTEDCEIPEIAAVMNWLNENAYKYGFILRYPEGKTDETGYMFEPWHYRYVGTELAEILYNNGDWITMEAYFGVDSVYRGY